MVDWLSLRVKLANAARVSLKLSLGLVYKSQSFTNSPSGPSNLAPAVSNINPIKCDFEQLANRTYHIKPHWATCGSQQSNIEMERDMCLDVSGQKLSKTLWLRSNLFISSFFSCSHNRSGDVWGANNPLLLCFLTAAALCPIYKAPYTFSSPIECEGFDLKEQ